MSGPRHDGRSACSSARWRSSRQSSMHHRLERCLRRALRRARRGGAAMLRLVAEVDLDVDVALQVHGLVGVEVRLLRCARADGLHSRCSRPVVSDGLAASSRTRLAVPHRRRPGRHEIHRRHRRADGGGRVSRRRGSGACVGAWRMQGGGAGTRRRRGLGRRRSGEPRANGWSGRGAMSGRKISVGISSTYSPGPGAQPARPVRACRPMCGSWTGRGPSP